MASRRSRRSSQDKDDDYLYESDNTSDYEEEEEDEDDEFDIATVKKTNKRKHEGDDSDSSSDSDHSSPGCKNKKCEGAEAKKRRVRYGWACTMCKLKHRSCDGQRPCGRCKSEGFADTCSDGPCCGSGSASEVSRGKEANFSSEAKIKKEEKDVCSPSSFHQACGAGRSIKQEPGQCSAGKPSSLSLLEHKIVAKVAEAVAIRVDALTGASSSRQPFLFQFLEPPKRVVGSTSTFPPTPQLVSRALNPYWPEKLFPQSFNLSGQYVASSAPMPSPKFSVPFLPEESFASLQPQQQQQATGFATTFVERAVGQPCWNVPNNCQQGYGSAYNPIESSACGEDNAFFSQNDFEAFLA